MLYNYLLIYRGTAANIPVIVTLAIIVVALLSFILMFTLKRKFGWPSTGTYILLAADLFNFSHKSVGRDLEIAYLHCYYEFIGNLALYL